MEVLIFCVLLFIKKLTLALFEQFGKANIVAEKIVAREAFPDLPSLLINFVEEQLQKTSC